MGPLELEERVAQSHRRGVARTGGQTWRGKPADTTRGNEARQAVGFSGSATGGVAGRLGCGRHRARESGNPPIGTTRRPTGRPLTNSDRPEMAHAEAEAAEFRQAQAERRGKRLLARLRAAWRREE